MLISLVSICLIAMCPESGKIHLTDDRDCFGPVMFPEEMGHKDIRW